MNAKENAGRRNRAERRKIPVTAAMKLSDCLVRFLLGAVLAGAEIPGGRAMFALAFVGVTRPGLEGLAALLGSALGYLSFRGFVGGLRYISAAMMVYAVALAMGEFNIYRRPWFMPGVAAVLNGMVGFVYQAAAGWSGAAAVGLAAEVILTAGAVYFYRLAFGLWEERRPGGQVTVAQTVGVLVLGASLLMTLERVTVADTFSLGRVLSVLAVMLAGWKGGTGIGAAAGITAGLAMDLASGLPPYYTLAYALPGLVTGIFTRQGRLLAALAYIMSGGVVILWLGTESGSGLAWELVAGAVLFLLLPDKLLSRFASLLRQETPAHAGEQARILAERRLRQTASAFRAVSGGLRGAFRVPSANDGDTSRIFDRAADRVCAGCRRREHCWQKEHHTTRTALSDALNRMLERGRGEREDFPPYFAGNCVKFDAFLTAANQELTAMLHRRRYDDRVRESRAAVCGQYDQLAEVLERTAAELGADLSPDIRRQRLVKQRMTALGVEGGCAVWQDGQGHLRLELTGTGADRLSQPGEVSRLSSLLGCPLKVEETGRGRATLAQREPLSAVAGVAAADRAGQKVSGDVGAWFKDPAGRLNVILCDGMGSGPAAREDSDCALGLLEKFLKAGLDAEEALRTVGEALALRGEERGGFTTVDMLRIDLYTGKCDIFKLGAAPTYLRRGGQVERVDCGSLPMGLAVGETCRPDRASVTLETGDWVVLVSDGVSTGREDEWLRGLLAEFDGLSPQELAGRVLRESGRRMGDSDDRTVMVLKMDERK